jgi:hypothetical protein
MQIIYIFCPLFPIFVKKNYLFTLFKTLISQKVWLLGKNDKNEVIRIELIEFYQLIWEKFHRVFAEKLIFKVKCDFFLVGGSSFLPTFSTFEPKNYLSTLFENIISIKLCCVLSKNKIHPIIIKELEFHQFFFGKNWILKSNVPILSGREEVYIYLDVRRRRPRSCFSNHKLKFLSINNYVNSSNSWVGIHKTSYANS